MASIHTTRIQRTAALLDRIYPDWYTRVDPDQINMCDGESCMAGLLERAYGDNRRKGRYERFARRLLRAAGRKERLALGVKDMREYDTAFRIGFGTRGKDTWKREIRSRLALNGAKAAS